MDCRLAREQLDAARADGRDREDPELQSAFAHLDDCDRCAQAYEFDRAFDRRVGDIIRRVDVPADLQARLRQSISAAETLPRPAQSIGGTPPLRRALLIATSAAALLLAAGWSWYLATVEPQPLAAATVLEWWRNKLSQKGFDVRTLPEFNGELGPEDADPRWRSLSQIGPRGADIDNDGADDAAVFPISGGFLVVLPANRVSNPPSDRAPGNAAPAYSPVLHVAWTNNQSMHICYLPGGNPQQLRQLLNKIYSGAA